jgi:hypothetical protein
MTRYDRNSRYYDCDTTNDLPQDELFKKSYSYYTIVVKANESGRLDLVSQRVYNTPVHWWIIARFNAIINTETAIAGTVLRIPQL